MKKVEEEKERRKERKKERKKGFKKSKFRNFLERENIKREDLKHALKLSVLGLKFH